MAKKIQKLPTGFKASKAGIIYEVIVEEYDLGYYIKFYTDGKLDNMTTRFNVEKVRSFLNREKSRLAKLGGWTIEDYKEINTRGININKLKR